MIFLNEEKSYMPLQSNNVRLGFKILEEDLGNGFLFALFVLKHILHKTIINSNSQVSG